MEELRTFLLHEIAQISLPNVLSEIKPDLGF